jgi:HSP20 family molecular chaperone IbpA
MEGRQEKNDLGAIASLEIPKKPASHVLAESARADIYEKDDELVLKVNLPGVDVNTIDVKIEDGTLKVNAQTVTEKSTYSGVSARERRRS